MTYLASPDDPGSVLFNSPQVARLLGFTPEEWLADPYFWHSRLHPDDREHVLVSDRRAMQAGTAFTVEYRLMHRDGYPVWFRDQGVLIRDDDGIPQFWLGFTVDLSEQRQAEEALQEIETRYRTLVEQLPVVTFIEPLDERDTPRYLSPQIEPLLGHSLEDFRENPELWAQSIHPDDRPIWRAEIERTDASGDEFNVEYRVIAADGRTVWVETTATLVTHEDGAPRYWQGIIQDTTDEVLAAQRLAESEERYRSLFDHNPDAVFSFDLEGVLLSLNPAFERMSGYSRDEAIGRPYSFLIPPEDLERVAQHFDSTASGIPENYECGVIRRDGSRFDINVTNLPIVVGGEIVGVYGIAKDISDRKALEDQLRHQAFHDPLTDLPNRSLFMDRLRHALNGLKRARRSIAVLFIDFDDFKLVNDSYGHDIGDQVLIAAAGIIQHCIRPGDTVSRLGGDEYTVLLTALDGVDEAIGVAERLLRDFAAPLKVAGYELTITPSVGIVVSSSPEDEPGALLRYADRAMYDAKASGKGRYVLSDRSHPAESNRSGTRVRPPRLAAE